jgi:ribosomal protein L10
MAITREKKRKILEQLKEKIEKQKIMIFIDFTGLKKQRSFLH